MRTTRRSFIKTAGAGALGLSLLPVFSCSRTVVGEPVAFSFPRVSPESQGVASSGIAKFINAANASGLQWHSFMMLRHGKVIAEGWWKPFDAGYKHTLYSLSKSFTSTAIGLLVKDGKLNVDDPLISFFEDELPADVSENLKQMKIKNLLTMNTGHGIDTMPRMRERTEMWTTTFLSLPVEHQPGTHFLYNTGATYMLGALVKKLSGQDVEAFLATRLFEPLDIEGYDWEKSPQGLSVAGWGLRVKTEDIAKLGQMYLQKGKWDGKEILPEAWVDEATGFQTTSNSGDGDWSQGYGYQFWRCKPGFYRGDGAFGQYCVVMPQHNVVVVVNSESWNMQQQMTLMWENLLPAIQKETLPESPADWTQLKSTLAALHIPVTRGARETATIKNENVVLSLPQNEYGVSKMELNISPDGCTWTTNASTGNQVIRLGWEKWLTGDESFPYVFAVSNRNPVPSKVAASATWIDANTLQLELRFVEAIHGDKITFRFDGDKVGISFLNSVAEHTKTNPDKRPSLEATRIKA